MLGGADNPNGELPSYITGADIVRQSSCWRIVLYKEGKVCQV